MVSYRWPARLRRMEHKRIEGATIIDDLYAGAMETPRWERAILRIADELGSHCAGLFALDLTTGRVLRDEGYRVPHIAIEEYREWAARDPRRELMMPVSPLQPMGEAHLMPLSQWRRTPIFNEFLKRYDCTYFLCTHLHKSDGNSVALSFQGTLDRGPFTDADRARLQPYVGHLARALEIRDRLEQHAVRADTLAESMNRATFGLMVLDDSGRVLEANPVVEQLMRRDASLSVDRSGRLQLRGRAHAELRHWLQHGRSSSGRPEATITVPRHLQAPLSLMLTPVSAATPLWIGSGPRWILFVFDPDAGALPSVEMLSKALQVSDREAEVALLLAQGLDPREVAERLGISLHTVRDHLKSVFAKTGTRSQVNLVRRILRMPTDA